MSQETGKEKTAEQTEKQPSELEQKVKALEQEKAELLKETMSRKEKLREYEDKMKQTEEAKLKEQGHYKELLEKVSPQAEKFEKWQPRVEKMLELELAEVPEDKRDLVPGFQDSFEKLEWVKNAKSKGLFGSPQPKKPANSIQSKGSESPGNLPDFVTWSSDDDRLAKLTPNEYQIWKGHNRRGSDRVVGW